MKKLILLSALASCHPVYAQESQSAQDFMREQLSIGVKQIVKAKNTSAVEWKFTRGRLTCAINVNHALASMGIKGTGSAAAMSFTSWGKPSSRKTGAVQISRRGKRGGHVEIVAENGMCWNPSSSKQRWVLVPCDKRKNIIGWRLA